jgi:secondary thiamine-phosphate synthase enzyme
MKHLFENHDLATAGPGEFVDVTGDVVSAVERSGVLNGQALVYSPHTTCTVLIQERESGFYEDARSLLDRLAPREGTYYRHDDLSVRTEGLEDDDLHPNGWSHLRASLLGSASQTIPIVDGKLLLGPWQKVFFCELDRARPRKVFIQITGE